VFFPREDLGELKPYLEETARSVRMIARLQEAQTMPPISSSVGGRNPRRLYARYEDAHTYRTQVPALDLWQKAVHWSPFTCLKMRAAQDLAIRTLGRQACSSKGTMSTTNYR
jgi:hypothetical protein